MEETRFKRKYIKWIGCSTRFQHIAEGIYYFLDINFKKVTIYPDQNYHAIANRAKFKIISYLVILL